MLGLTRRLGQGNADREVYDFSLSSPILPFFQAFEALPRRRQSVNNIRSTLAIVWRIAAPYFRSEDKWAGRALLAAVIAIELALVAIDVLVNQWHNRFYNALQEKNWDGFVWEIDRLHRLGDVYVALAVYQLYLNQWLQIRWRRWMTSNYLGEWLHRRQPLSHAASGRCRRQSGPAHRRRRQAVRRANADIGVGLLELDRLAGVLCRHPVGSVRDGTAAPVRQRLRYPRLSGVGRADLCGARNGADALDRLRRWSTSISSSSASRPISASTWCGCAKTPNRSRCCRARAPSASGFRSASAASSTTGTAS